MRAWNAVSASVFAALVAVGCEEGGAQHEEIKGVAPKFEQPTTTTLESNEAFSYTPPAGWQMMSMPGGKYRSAVGVLKSSGTAPSISVVEETFRGSLADFAEQKVAALRQSPQVSGNIEEVEFQTASGAGARRVAFETLLNATKFRQSMYFFGQGDRKFIVACMTPLESADALAPVFDTCMKTFRVAGE
jgi:hypothetical protein